MLYKELKRIYGYNSPIFADEILNIFNQYTKAYVYRMLNEDIENKKIKKYSQGVYFIPQNTVLGETTITARDVVFKKYIYNKNKDEVNGIFSGLTLANEFNLTTQVPNTLEIITNNEATRLREIEINGMRFNIKKARTKINKDNIYAYKLLELFTENDIKDFNGEVYDYVLDYVKKFRIKQNDVYLLLDAFPNKTSKRIIQSKIFTR